ncbi:hypothetical protein [Nitrosomonas sp. Nm33]|uniref:hypothetical protein n=1 Tax=Nitrosomonas sp. Nm33 TaxID=133724 RepID=UPI00089A76F7|nr:hypothetical protein [Nitrosomonas sp. Nm33]SDY70581.1 hypothetical protein SAMN05421755_10415 [Nitrosomonas sp. Nm33]
MQEEKAFLIDGINTIAIHNGVVRIQFMRLGMDGKPEPNVQLHVPIIAMKSVVEAFRKATPG